MQSSKTTYVCSSLKKLILGPLVFGTGHSSSAILACAGLFSRLDLIERMVIDSIMPQYGTD
jgi:hypothetical protein